MSELTKEIMFALLREIRKIAIEASMTRSMRGATAVLADAYNRCLQSLSDQGDTVVTTLFVPLPRDTASLDEVGASAALLSRYIFPEERGFSHQLICRLPEDQGHHRHGHRRNCGHGAQPADPATPAAPAEQASDDEPER